MVSAAKLNKCAQDWLDAHPLATPTQSVTGSLLWKGVSVVVDGMTVVITVVRRGNDDVYGF